MIVMLWKAAALAWKLGKWLTATLCILTILQGLLPAASLWVAKLLIDAVVAQLLHRPEPHFTVAWCLLLLALVSVASSALSQAVAAGRTLLGSTVSHGVSTMVLEQAASLDLRHFEEPAFYDTLQRAERDGAQRPHLILAQVLQIIQSAVSAVSLCAVLCRLSWGVLLFQIVLASPHVWFEARYAKGLYALRRRRTQDTREIDYLSSLLTAVDYVKEVKLFGLAPHLLERHDRLFNKTHLEERRHVIGRGLAAVIASSLAAVGYVMFYAYVVNLARRGWLTIGGLAMYSGAYLQAQAQIEALFRNGNGLFEHGLFIRHLYEYLGLRPRVASPPTPRTCPHRLVQGIELRNVSFRYADSQRYALKNVSLTVAPGETVAIVGANGAGKTTLLKLICRFYDPDEGQVLLDGVDIREFDLQDYRRTIGAVFQDFVRYQFTADENIACGELGRVDQACRVRRAAAASGVDEVVARLPNGYGTMLGTYFEGGCQLSTGEWQRVALARGCYRDSPILLLDEPTASLDPLIEHEMFVKFRDMADGKACIIVSHRLSATVGADRILVFEGGRLIEEGGHADLIRARGVYSGLFSLQASAYCVDWRTVASESKSLTALS